MKGIVCSIDGIYGTAMVCSKYKDDYTVQCKSFWIDFTTYSLYNCFKG